MRQFFAIIVLMTAIGMQGDVVFNTEDYDFGTFREEDGVKRGEVTMRNTGSRKVQIVRVRPSCGCTSAGFDKEVLLPGDSARVWFTFDPSGRPGRFGKNVRVYLDKETGKPEVVRFHGTVIGSERSLSEDYPVKAGPLRLSGTEMNAGKVTYGKTKSGFITIYNTSDATQVPEWDVKGLPMTAMSTEGEVKPGEMMTLSLLYNSVDDDMMGESTREWYFYPEGKKAGGRVTMTLVTDLEPDLASVDPATLADAQVVSLSTDLIDLGTVKGNKKRIEREFEVANLGKSDLAIKRIYSKEGHVKVKQMPFSLKGGKKGKVKLEIDMEGIAEGPFSLRLDVCSDDPVHPFQPLRIAGIKE